MHSFCRDEHLGVMIKFINHDIVNEVNRNLANYNVTLVQHEIICCIAAHEEHLKKEIFQKDIEEKFKLTNPTVTGILNRLEEKQLVERRTSCTDGRCKSLHLTEKGHMLLAKTHDHGANYIEKKIVKGMSEEEVENLRNLLYRVYKNMEE